LPEKEHFMSVAGITETCPYLTFILDSERYALEIHKVREVLEFTKATRVPRMPEYMRGVINLRGNVVPVLDLRLKFGLSRTERTVDTCVIIAEVDVDGEPTILGALADSVEEVLDLEPDQIDPPPRMGARLKTEFIRGMGKRDDHFIILLDIDKVFTAEELRVAGSRAESESISAGAAA
jgi:purine-binding chemotaxis protein CheW